MGSGRVLGGAGPVPAIGSDAWSAELVEIGLDRGLVDERLRIALRRGHPAPTGHDVDLSAGELDAAGVRELASARLLSLVDDDRRALALEAAVGVLFHERYPGYAQFIYWNRLMLDARELRFEALVDWMVRQLAAMVQHGRPEVADSADYALGVDFFESCQYARIVVPRLVALMDEGWRAEFLGRSGYVDWLAKRAFYLEEAASPARHPALAAALEGSVWAGFFGTVDGAEGLDLLSMLHIEEPLRERVRATLTTPIRAWVGGVVTMTRPTQTGEDLALLLAFERYPLAPKSAPYHGVPSWFVGAEVWWRGRAHGRVVSTRRSQDPAKHGVDPGRVGEVVLGRRSAPPAGYEPSCYEWHFLRSEAEGAGCELVEEEVELRPNTAVSRSWRRLRERSHLGDRSNE